MKIKISLFLTVVLGLLHMADAQNIVEAAIFRGKKESALDQKSKSYGEYMKLFEDVYKTMQENYYQDVSRESFDRFIEKFNTKIYAQLKGEKKSDDYVRWRSAAFLVDHLKSSEDVFSAFYPPEPAKEYEETALGIQQDLGIEGDVTDAGFKVSRVEPRSDAYVQGLREQNIITGIDESTIIGFEKEKILELLMPLINTKVRISYLDHLDQRQKMIEVLSKEYFKQSIFMEPTRVPWIYKVELQHFNRMTGEDLFRLMQFYRQQGPILGLIIDLRKNPGGPPLAAREISSMFLKGGDNFAYFQKNNQAPSMLDVPVIPEQYRYDGPMVILVDHGSGSASELFAGVMQRRGRAVLMGVNSAGQVMLKSMFHFDDKSMLLLVTARGHHTDGVVFSFGGLIPDRYVDESQDADINEYAIKYLMYMNIKK
jgi:carboxyl-terminal processing protease